MNNNTKKDKMKVCSIDGCGKKHEAKGYCKKHYKRFKKHGDPLYVQKRKPCKVDGCNKLSRNWGYCPTHASRYYTHGDPLKTLINTGNNGKCSVKGCGDVYYAKDLCGKHYREKYRRELLLTEKGKNHYRLQYEKRRARKLQAPINDFNLKDWQNCLYYFDYRCAYCGEKSDVLEQDHVIPLSCGGSHTKSNIVPSCKMCNRKKWSFLIQEWYPNYEHYDEKREEKILKYLGYKLKGDKIQLQLF